MLRIKLGQAIDLPLKLVGPKAPEVRAVLLASDGMPLGDAFQIKCSMYRGGLHVSLFPSRSSFTAYDGYDSFDQTKLQSISAREIGGIRLDLYRRKRFKRGKVLVAAAVMRLSPKVVVLENFVLEANLRFGIPGKPAASLAPEFSTPAYVGPILGSMSVTVSRGSAALARAAGNFYDANNQTVSSPKASPAAIRSLPNKLTVVDASGAKAVKDPKPQVRITLNNTDESDDISSVPDDVNLLSRSLAQSTRSQWDAVGNELKKSAHVEVDIGQAQWELTDDGSASDSNEDSPVGVTKPRRSKDVEKKHQRQGSRSENRLLKSSEVTVSQILGLAADDEQYDGNHDGGIGEPDDSIRLQSTSSSSGLTQSKVLETSEHDIAMVRDVLGVGKELAVLLLRHFKWDRARLVSDFFDDPERVAKAIGLDVTELSRSQQQVVDGSVNPDGGLVECQICFDDDPDEIRSLPYKSCHEHTFCSDCWRQYIGIKAKEADVIAIRCMAEGCQKLIPESMIKDLVSDDIFTKFREFTANTFVDTNSGLKWCPEAGCSRAIAEVQTVTLGCGNVVARCAGCSSRICFTCMDEDHSPATCQQAKAWRQKNSDDGETFNWIAANTKPCPKCEVPIEKNDGCFQMSCGSCHHQFCWLCLQDWSTHGDHFQCAKYGSRDLDNKPVWMDDKDGEAERKRSYLDKYMHYYNRFINHDKSREHEKELGSKIEAKTDELAQAAGLSFADCEFLRECAAVLQDCRWVLKWGFVWSFYVDTLVHGDQETKKEGEPANNESAAVKLAPKALKQAELSLDLFRESLTMLEEVTEKLATALERDLDAVIQPGKRYQMKHVARVCRKTVANMLSHKPDIAAEFNAPL